MKRVIVRAVCGLAWIGSSCGGPSTPPTDDASIYDMPEAPRDMATPTDDMGHMNDAGDDPRDAVVPAMDSGSDANVDSGSARDTGPPPSGSRGLAVPATETIAHTGSLPMSTGLFIATFNIASRTLDSGDLTRVYRPASPAPVGGFPLVLFFPGTGDSTESIVDALGGQSGIASALAAEPAVFIVVPRAEQTDSRGDWDHPFDGFYWDTTTEDPNANLDLRLVRALIQEARASGGYAINPSRVYLMGHSSGAFFAEFAAYKLSDRIAGYAENAGGWVRCLPAGGKKSSDQDIGITSTSCDAILRVSGMNAANFACTSAMPEPFTALPSTAAQRVPAYLTHEMHDTVVSPYYTCDLSRALAAAGYTEAQNLRTLLYNGNIGCSSGCPVGHVIAPGFVQTAWAFLRPFRL